MIEWVNKPPLPKDEDGNKGENCKCKKQQNEDKKCHCCLEPKQLLRCQCNSSYKERYLRHLCQCESPEIENEDYCPCNRRNSYECCKCKCGGHSDDEIPEKDTPKGDSKQAKSKGNVTEETNTEEIPAAAAPRTADTRSTTRAARSGNLQPSVSGTTEPNEAPREQREAARGGAGRTENPAPVQEEGRMRRGGAGSNESNRAPILYNQDYLQQVPDHGAIAELKTESNQKKDRKQEQTEIVKSEDMKVTNEIPPELMMEYRCTSCLPTLKRKKRIWLPAQVTQVVLRNLKCYLNNKFYGQSCECNDAVCVCTNKD